MTPLYIEENCYYELMTVYVRMQVYIYIYELVFLFSNYL